MAMTSTAASAGGSPRHRVVGLTQDPVVVLLEMTARLASSDPSAALASLGQAAGLLRGRAAEVDRPRDLTTAEERVVVLAASGRSNQTIAAQLFLSIRTVECHLSHAYAKLGVHSKAELAAWWALNVAGALD
jgi:DNA-binding NarL/FixJ family response regulator